MRKGWHRSSEAGAFAALQICDIGTTSALHLQLHLNGRAHQRKARLAAEAAAAGRRPCSYRAAHGAQYSAELARGLPGRQAC